MPDSRHRGLDFDTTDDQFNYGGNIYKDYDAFDSGVKVGQGNKTTIVRPSSWISC
jgi:hypothetical protein